MKSVTIDNIDLKSILMTTANDVIGLESELNTLDRAIGDGDHGYNMSRGARALIDDLDGADMSSLSSMFAYVGNTLISSIGGASGALYGTFFISVGQCVGDNPTASDFIDALDAGVKAIMQLGDSDVNQKTMLDVIVPVLALLRQVDRPGLVKILQHAEHCSTITIDMKAEKGRASLLGDRSIGYMDPGARSSQAIISSICKALI